MNIHSPLMSWCWQGVLSAAFSLQVLETRLPAVDDQYLLTLTNITTQGYLFPSSRDAELLSRLRASSKFPRIPTRTNKYQSFLSYALAH